MPLDTDAMTPRRGRSACAVHRWVLLLCLGSLLVPAACAQGRRAHPLTDPPRPYFGAVESAAAQAVARTTLAILEFARWPGEPREVRLCVVGTTPYAGALLASRPVWRERGRHLSVRQRTARDVSADCDALYLGRLPEADARALHRRIAGEARITISEGRDARDADEGCDEDMFCLDLRGRSKVGFVVNRDALARSGVRVQPGVLQLGTRRAHGT